MAPALCFALLPSSSSLSQKIGDFQRRNKCDTLLAVGRFARSNACRRVLIGVLFIHFADARWLTFHCEYAPPNIACANYFSRRPGRLSLLAEKALPPAAAQEKCAALPVRAVTLLIAMREMLRPPPHKVVGADISLHICSRGYLLSSSRFNIGNGARASFYLCSPSATAQIFFATRYHDNIEILRAALVSMQEDGMHFAANQCHDEHSAFNLLFWQRDRCCCGAAALFSRQYDSI